MEAENDRPSAINKKTWVINLSQKPLTVAKRSLLEKGPKFAPTPQTIPVKDIVSEVEAAIVHLPDHTKDAVRTTTASLLPQGPTPTTQEHHQNRIKSPKEL